MEDMTRRDYEHSRPLDVHRWSDHPEVNAFVDRIYKEHIHQSGTNTQIKKKHLKVVLLDLYVAWSDDPNLNIAVHMSMNAYSDGTVSGKGKSRYNALNIKVSTIDIVHSLRHFMRERLRAVECPSDIIDQIGGWLSSSVGSSYGKGYSVAILAKWMERIKTSFLFD